MAMNRAQSETAMAVAGAVPDGRFPMFEAALACALHEDGARDGDDAHRLVSEAVERLRIRLKTERPEDALCEALGGDLQLGADLFTPEAPANADLIAVCERRKGLSITLGLIYLEAGRRAGLDLCGVDFPGHFLLRVETNDGPIALDPYAGGRVVMPSELTRRALNAGLMPGVADRLDTLMTSVTDRQVVLRLQSLIFARAVRGGAFELAERSALRRALLSPEDHRPWLDVAAAREGQGRLAGALDALNRAEALGGGPGHSTLVRDRVRRRLN